MTTNTADLLSAIQNNKVADAKEIFHQIIGKKCYDSIESRKETIFKEIK